MRCFLALASLASVLADSVYIQGGYTNGGNPQQLVRFNTATTPPSFTTLTASQTGDIPPANRNLGRSAVLYNGRLYVFGGCDAAAVAFSNDMYSWNPANNQWTNLRPPAGTSTPSPRCYHTAVLDTALDMMLVYGGQTGTTSFSGVVFAYQFSTNTWIPFVSSGTGTNLPPSRCSASGVYNTNTRSMFIFGGYSVDSSNVVTRYNGLFELHIDSASAGTWELKTPTGTNPGASDSQCAVYVQSRNVMVTYGGGSTSNNINQMWTYSFATNTWTQVTFSGLTPFNLRGHSCYENNNIFYSIGGSSTSLPSGVPTTTAVQRFDLTTNTVSFLSVTAPPGGYMYAAFAGTATALGKFVNVSATA